MIGGHCRVATDNDGRCWTTGNDEHLPLLQARHINTVIESWRIDDEWWRTPIHRRYFDVVLEGGGHTVLFEDLTTHQWFMQKP
jgi:hypothetical protein